MTIVPTDTSLIVIGGCVAFLVGMIFTLRVMLDYMFGDANTADAVLAFLGMVFWPLVWVWYFGWAVIDWVRRRFFP